MGAHGQLPRNAFWVFRSYGKIQVAVFAVMIEEDAYDVRISIQACNVQTSEPVSRFDCVDVGTLRENLANLLSVALYCCSNKRFSQ